jgi:hypothetical protein
MIVWCIGAIPIWPIMTKLSNNLVRDAIIYDLIIYVIGLGTIIYLTNDKLGEIQVIGIVIMLIGFLLTLIK